MKIYQIISCKKISCILCNKCRKLKNPEISYNLQKTFVSSFIFDIYGSNDGAIFKEDLKVLGLTNKTNEQNILCRILLINMVEGNMSLKNKKN